MNAAIQPTTRNRQAQRRQPQWMGGVAKAEIGELVLIRGLPGSGKSTMAKVLAQVGYEHYEADMFFERDGVYAFDAARIREAHEWCRSRVTAALSRGARVVFANTFTRRIEMAPYFAMTSNIRVVEALGRWGSIHNVPENKLQAMAARWEPMRLDDRRLD